MSRLLTFFLQRLPLILFFIIYFLITLLTYKDYGMTMDEFFVYRRGEYFYTKIKGNDPELQKGFVIKDRNNENLLYYNSTYPALLHIFNDNGSYEEYHLLNIVFSASIFLLFYELLLRIYKNPLKAILGPIFLFFTPRFIGHIPANPKDIPFAILYFANIFSIYRARFWESKIRLLILGILIGLAASIRVIGFSLLVIYPIYRLIENILVNKNTWKKSIKDLFLETIIMSLIAFLIFLISMPYIAADPYNHFIELLNISKQYPWNGEIFFLGKMYLPKEVIYIYLPLLFLITTPIFIIVGFLGSFIKKFTLEKNLLKILLLISIFFHLGLYFIIKPIVYNNIRHYLFLLPQIVLLSTIFYLDINKKKFINIFLISIVLINIVGLAYSYITLHPYQYIYFNFLAGGIKNAQNNFELDYWGASDKEALFWLKDYLKKNNETSARVYDCSRSDSLPYYLPEAIDSNSNVSKANYIVCYNQLLFNGFKKFYPGTTIHQVKRQNTVLNSIYKLK